MKEQIAELEAAIAKLRFQMALRQKVPAALPRPTPPTVGAGDIGVHEDLLTRTSSNNRNSSASRTAYLARADTEAGILRIYQSMLAIDSIQTVGQDFNGYQYIQLIGRDRSDHICHFLPWVQVSETPPDERLHPVGFTLLQLFEIEWASYSMTLNVDWSTSDYSSPGSTATFTNRINNTAGRQRIPDERYLMLRGGLLWYDGMPDTFFNETDARSSFCRAEVRIGLMEYLTDGDGKPSFTTWPQPEKIAVESSFILVPPPFDTSTWRVIYYDGLFYPAMFVAFEPVVSPDEITGNPSDATARIYATANIFDEDFGGFSSLGDDDFLTISGTFGVPEGDTWTVPIPMKVTPEFGPGASTGKNPVVNGASITLNHWPSFDA